MDKQFVCSSPGEIFPAPKFLKLPRVHCVRLRPHGLCLIHFAPPLLFLFSLCLGSHKNSQPGKMKTSNIILVGYILEHTHTHKHANTYTSTHIKGTTHFTHIQTCTQKQKHTQKAHTTHIHTQVHNHIGACRYFAI